MKTEETTVKLEFSARSYLFLFLISLIALAATFLFSNIDSAYPSKLLVFSAIVFFYLLSCALIYRQQKKRTDISTNVDNLDSPFNTENESKLLALEDVHRFFSSSLKSADMFRLIASRVNEIIPYADCALLLPDKTSGLLNISNASGNELRNLIGQPVDFSGTFIQKSFQTGDSQIEDKSDIKNPFKKYNSAIAVALKSGEKVFGVFVLYGQNECAFDRKSLTLFEAVATRIAPLLYSSQTFDENVSSALTDALTSLPNERGFFLVLENQIAESVRYRDKRPLAILAIDIKSFAEHNQRFGHAIGNQLLIFTAETIKKQLRQMDLLARSTGDEFLIILPTATDETTREIVERVERVFNTNPFSVNDDEKIHLKLCFGAASFGRNGETAESLINHALLEKQQSKLITGDKKILWFPKEYVN